MTIESQPAGPTFARCARVNGTCTTYGRIYIYKKHLCIYIPVYDEDFPPLYDKCGARAARQLVNATALGLAYPAARQVACTSCSVGFFFFFFFSYEILA